MRKFLLIYLTVFLSFFSFLFSCFGQEQEEDLEEPVKATIEGHIFRPGKVDATEERVQQLQLPQGFKVNKFAEGFKNSRMITCSKSGAVYFTDREQGTVVMLRDTNQDGKADIRKVVAKREKVHGIAISDNQMYLATITELLRADIKQDGTLGNLQVLMDDLPDGGQHPNRTLRFGPDGKLYISIGSTCNACEEPNPEHATILVSNADGSDRRVFASGLRNTLGFDWHPETRRMYGMDHGIDWLGDEEQREELNLIEEGEHYGWPYIYGEGNENPRVEPEEGYQEFKRKTVFPVLTHTAHSSGMDMIFYTGDHFPQEYKGDAFVAFRGSWNRSEPVGYKLGRIKFANNEPVEFEDFMTGFLVNNNQQYFGRLVGVAMHPDGYLLVTDDTNGVVYRISYDKRMGEKVRKRKK
jgi:glucose/arabinose dehydrogenase